MSEKRGTLRASSGNLVEASDRMPKGPGIKGGETRIRPAKPTTNPGRFHAQFILEHPETPSKAARVSLPPIGSCRHARGSGLPAGFPCLRIRPWPGVMSVKMPGRVSATHDHSSRPGSRLIQSKSRRAAAPKGSPASARLDGATQRASEKPGPGLSSPDDPRAT
jgi:hypothetical protein